MANRQFACEPGHKTVFKERLAVCHCFLPGCKVTSLLMRQFDVFVDFVQNLGFNQSAFCLTPSIVQELRVRDRSVGNLLEIVVQNT